MHVAINAFFWNQPATGSGQYVRQLVRHLLEEAPELNLLLVAPPETLADAPWGQALPIAIEMPLPGNMGKFLYEQWVFPQVSHRQGAKVLHVPYFAPPWHSRIPVVVTIHDLIPLLLPEYRGNALVRGYTAWVAQAAKRAACVLTDSQASARDIVSRLNIPAERVRVIYLATGPTFHPVPKEQDTSLAMLRTRLALPSEYILYLGGFDQRKHVTELLYAYKRARLAEEGLPLVIAGQLPLQDTPFTPNPRRIAAELGLQEHVRFVGWVPEEDKPALYRGARFFCFPSAYEGFGLPVLEAIACGTPVIAGKGSSLEEVGGPGGLYVSPHDIDELAEALRQLATDAALRARLSHEGLAHAQRFSWRQTARQTAQIYDEVAHG